MSGTAGTGKTYLAMAFAVNEILQKRRRRIILTRPIVEAGESIGFLPGDISEKVNPYMMPLFDSLHKLVGSDNPQRDAVNAALQVVTLGFMRGMTFDDAVCIFDEAQNATRDQFKLFLTRFGENSKIIITGDPGQSDLPGPVALVDVMRRLETLPGVGMVEFPQEAIVRHPLVSGILDRFKD